MTEPEAKGGAGAWDLLGADAGEMFHRFSHEELKRILPENPVPATAQEWAKVRAARLARLREAMGVWPPFGSEPQGRRQERCDLQPEIVASEDRGDFIFERVLLRSRPNLVMTTHL